ncbi:hypothetical protein Q4E93_16190 [Flavitalea sp. BT771]|uniref:hypothetical protein n=1 Tax=Flavitalea sp. BT771 TaxID=3063329 RepID=UPI0026E3E370|nr:hypothetical protein [Flavitalea sp. BT771]MDO6432143.1 hypothetical protein [Flavitalea sp. BT771]MDV6221052.1 hypothetical protein [Flavitalea sp. BT771]
MKVLTLIAAAGALFLPHMEPETAQKKVSELTLVYDYSVVNGKTSSVSENATHTVYIKGNKSRSEIVSPIFSSTVIFDASTGFGVILKEVSGQKLLIRLNPDNWKERNRLYDGMVFKTTTSETKEIAGYKCQKATATTHSGSTITVFYTKDLLTENKEYDPPFRNLEGLPLEYELASGEVKISYRVSRISLNPVPVSKFDIPKSGYREMNYEESKKMKIGG